MRSRPPTARLAEARSAPSELLVLGRYRLHRRLGAGGFGTVWLARDERLDREVAVKVLPRERIVGGRFEREARAAARLAHPGIVTLYEAAVDDEGAYLVSELVRGGTLDEALEAGRLSDRDIVMIGIALCEALAHAHAQGIVHRDVKPSNVLLPEGPASPQVAKLTDFGVARVIGGDSLTRTGEVIGTAAYMAPEQAEGREARAPADLYSLAVVLYEALTGVNPVRTGTAAQRARRLGAYLPPLRRQRRDLPRELGQGIDLALRPRPRERGSLEELREALCTAAERVDDRPGVVTSAWSAQADDERPDTGGPSRSDRVEQARAATWPARAAAAAAAAALAAWVDAHLLSPAPIAASAAALTAGLLIAALPRIGWAVLAATISGSLALQSRPGAALLVLIASLVPVMLLPHRPASWPLSAAATALGLLGLAGMWPALAALASTVWRRTALGIAGWLWLVLMTPLADADLYIRPSHTPAAVWTLSLYGTTHQLLGQIVTAEMLAPAIVWGLAAATLPRITRGPLPIDIVLIAVWAATVASVTATVVGRGQITGRHALLGAVAGALVALVPAVVRAWTRARDSANAGAGLA